MNKSMIGILFLLIVSMMGNLYFAFSPEYNQQPEPEVDPIQQALDRQAWEYYFEAKFNVHYHYRMKHPKLRDAYIALAGDIAPYVNEGLTVTEPLLDKWYMTFDQLRVQEAGEPVNYEVAQQAQGDAYWEVYGTRDWKEAHRMGAARKR